MANDYVPVSPASPQGGELLRRVADLRSAYDGLIALEAHAQHMHDGADYATVEQQFGLPAGAGANFLTLLGLVIADIGDGQVVELLARFGRG